jgi:hypothetical protein
MCSSLRRSPKTHGMSNAIMLLRITKVIVVLESSRSNTHPLSSKTEV